MTRLTFDVSMSLDGFITGRDPRPAEPLGDGGERLHDWMAGLTDLRSEHRTTTDTPDKRVQDEFFANRGALLMGRGMFDAGEEPWGDDPPFGMPVFVVTHRPRETIAKRGGTTYHFVTDGLEAALEQARAAAGGKDVGLVGGGVRLFEPFEGDLLALKCTQVTPSTGVTHLRYRVRR